MLSFRSAISKFLILAYRKENMLTTASEPYKVNPKQSWCTTVFIFLICYQIRSNVKSSRGKLIHKAQLELNLVCPLRILAKFTKLKTLLSEPLTGRYTITNSARRENCEIGAQLISAVEEWEGGFVDVQVSLWVTHRKTKIKNNLYLLASCLRTKNYVHIESEKCLNYMNSAKVLKF